MTHEQIIDARLSALEATCKNLVQVFNQNANAFGAAHHAADAMIHVLQRVVNDLLKWDARVARAALATTAVDESTRLENLMEHCEVKRDAQGAIDFPWYIGQFYGALGFTNFMTAWKAWSETHRVVPDGEGGFRVEEIAAELPEAEGETEEENDITIFGDGEMHAPGEEGGITA